jgi:hypothetical protein
MSNQISDVLNLQDTELANAMSELSSDPVKLNSFITQRKSDVYNAVTKEHSDSFKKVYGDFTRASDGTSNILSYHTRNKDLDKTQEAVLNKATTDANAIRFDSQNAKRQFEMNEWTANNKLDTLFFFQLLLITLTLMTPLLYMSKIGLIPTTVYYGVSMLIGIAVVLTLIVRAQYTMNTRDTRYWNRRKFAQMGGPPTTITCDALSGLGDDAIAAYASVQSGAQNAITGAISSSASALSSAANTLKGQ